MLIVVIPILRWCNLILYLVVHLFYYLWHVYLWLLTVATHLVHHDYLWLCGSPPIQNMVATASM